VDIVGPMPEELQDAVIHFGAMSSAAGVPAAAQALLDFLKTPEAIATLKSKAMAPG
jgi:hypothetical protein